MNRANVDRPGKAARTLIILFSILLTICLVVTFIIIPLNRTALNADFYINTLNQNQVYSQMPDLVTGSIITSIQETEFNSLNNQILAALTEDQISALVAALIPPEWVETQTNLVIHAIMDFVNLKSTDLMVVIDLQPIKENLVGPAGKQAFTALLSNLPTCTIDQLNLILTSLQNGQTGFELCNPSLDSTEMMEFLMQPVITDFNESIPAAITIPSAGQAELVQSLVKSNYFKAYRSYRQALAIIPWISLGLGFLILMLSLRSWRWSLTALGLPLVFSGMAAALPGAWLYMNSSLDFKSTLSSIGFALPVVITDTINTIGQELLRSLGWSMLIWSLGALVAGLILVAIRFIFGEQKRNPISSAR